MNNKLLIGLAIVGSIVGGIIGAKVFAPLVGGDFAGGVVPSKLLAANALTNSLTPVLANFYVTGSLSAGGIGVYNQVAALVSASSSPSSVVTLGPFNSTTSTASSSFTIFGNTSDLQVGDPCGGDANTSSVYVDGCNVTAVGNGNATGTLYFSNALAAVNALATSTIFRISLLHLPY